MIRIKNFNVPFNDQSPINDLVAKRLKLREKGGPAHPQPGLQRKGG